MELKSELNSMQDEMNSMYCELKKLKESATKEQVRCKLDIEPNRLKID